VAYFYGPCVAYQTNGHLNGYWKFSKIYDANTLVLHLTKMTHFAIFNIFYSCKSGIRHPDSLGYKMRA